MGDTGDYLDALYDLGLADEDGVELYDLDDDREDEAELDDE